ncbi:MAG: A/G-specific adenine glycosylase, partial [Bdellovibrionaceae bacterium]|nr:A/G-specific adenine glycosylase [Pseudobdellovibrionaceae bacterium]
MEVHRELLRWYSLNKRPLPWRAQRDPYAIWLSEVMLQQTTVAAVLPYWQKFIERFPTVQDLATAPLSEVLALWSGLGYYSRAKLLHQSAKKLAHTGFPKTWSELIQLPGFGPYTARALSSIAFAEPVGVVDGNVIRFLCRLTGQKIPWWQSAGRSRIQNLSDKLASMGQPGETNQAVM